MAARTAFTDRLMDRLSPLGPVTLRSMFGGFGIFLDGAMFALVADDTLYLKADDVNRDGFEAAGMSPFVYQGKTKPVAMSYYEVAPDSIEDPDVFLSRAQSAVDAAVRTKSAKGSRRRKP